MFTLILTIHKGQEILSTHTGKTFTEKEDILKEWRRMRHLGDIDGIAVILKDGMFEEEIAF